MKVPFSPPDISELEISEVSDALRSGWITTGPKTKLFEQRIAERCGTERAVCLASATAAMELALRALGIGEGDEVITSAYTFTASASVISHVGARTVIVDTEPGSFHISPDKLAAAITERTKAVIPIDVGGIPVQYDRVLEAIKSKKSLFRPNGELQRQLGRVAVVSDCAHSFGAAYKGKDVACYGDFSCFSFHAVKNLTTAEGGAIAFSSVGSVSADTLYDQFQLFSLHGQNKDALAKTKLGAWEYDILIPGYKCNMTDIMAALGLAQLARYDELLSRRKEIVARYDRHFKGTAVHPIAHRGADYCGTHHLYIIQIDGIDEHRRNEIISMLAQDGVSANVHYKPLPMMTAYKNMGFDIKDYPNAFDFYSREITLPLHTLLSDEQVDFVAEKLIKAVSAQV